MRVDTLLHPPQVGGDDARRDPFDACAEALPMRLHWTSPSIAACVFAALQDLPGSGAVCSRTARLPVHRGKIPTLSSPRAPN